MNNDNDFSEHPIRIFCSYQELKLDNIPDFIKQRIRKLLDESNNPLHELLHVANQIQHTDFSGYKEAYAKKLIANELLGPRTKLQTVIRQNLQEIEQGFQNLENRKIQLCKPKIHDNPSEQIAQTLKLQEIRQLLRNMSYKQKLEAIENDIENGVGDYIRAISDSPDSIVHKDTLKQLQHKYAIKQEPSLTEFERQHIAVSQLIRKKCSELNATQIAILRSKNLEDPITIESHFETFPPATDREMEIAKQKIQEEKNRIRQEELKEDFEKKNAGINLD